MNCYFNHDKSGEAQSDEPLGKIINALLEGMDVIVNDIYGGFSEQLLELTRDELLILEQENLIQTDEYLNALSKIHISNEPSFRTCKSNNALVLTLNFSWKVEQLINENLTS
ncbi:hypothetical protein HUG15_20635 [Salicibibacter cibarius]|uniref:Uncharacterized protein n=1 Tax=Salicibibacter cibarius TaxID=2743000 RepID=A0A7T6Z6L0_9BACI|nr:hypothetical protein [Salicibibacter cibarius]QQK77751.1 hypothetical protein HUG15_20635 [Salicibibacter cibarius]